MLVFRSLTLGLLGACVLLLAQLQLRQPSHVHVVNHLPAPTVPAPASMAPTIINIATQECHIGSGMRQPCFATDLLPLLRVAPDERVTAIGDTKVDPRGFAELARQNGMGPVAEDIAADSALAFALWQAPKGPGRYLDVAISSERGERRVVVLMH
jgi:hypothetical protein